MKQNVFTTRFYILILGFNDAIDQTATAKQRESAIPVLEEDKRNGHPNTEDSKVNAQSAPPHTDV